MEPQIKKKNKNHLPPVSSRFSNFSSLRFQRLDVLFFMDQPFPLEAITVITIHNAQKTLPQARGIKRLDEIQIPLPPLHASVLLVFLEHR